MSDLSLRDLVFSPKTSKCKLFLNNEFMGLFDLGGKEIVLMIENDDLFGDECINIRIDKNTAELNDFFYFNSKQLCSGISTSLFFKLFDILLPNLGIKRFVLQDASYKSLNNCHWELGTIQYFLTGKTFYSKFGFHRKQPNNNQLEQFRRNTKLSDVTNLFEKNLTNIQTIINDNSVDVNTILLQKFLKEYLNPVCESSNLTQRQDVLQSILKDISDFLKIKLNLQITYPDKDSYKEYHATNSVPAFIKITKTSAGNTYNIYVTEMSDVQLDDDAYGGKSMRRNTKRRKNLIKKHRPRLGKRRLSKRRPSRA